MIQIWFELVIMHLSMVEYHLLAFPYLFNGFYHKTCSNCNFAFILTFTTKIVLHNQLDDFDYDHQ